MSGRWSSPDIDHINALEMRAIFLVVSHWASPPPPPHPPVAGQEGTGSIRQCLHSAIYQPSRRDNFPQTVSPDSNVADSSGQWHLAECSTHKG